ncbi:SDR family oxidoreductase [Bacillus sp. XF8]|nr:SDR family oxidoreductase [Bacillus sp. XF8]
MIALALGAIDTPIIQGYKDLRLIDAMKAKVMGNKLTQPEQIADTIHLISLEEASTINGSVVIADEGYASFK